MKKVVLFCLVCLTVCINYSCSLGSKAVWTGDAVVDSLSNPKYATGFVVKACDGVRLVDVGENYHFALVIAWRPLCRQPRTEHPSCTHAGDCQLWHPGGYCDGILRPHHVYRPGCSPSHTGHLPHQRPSHPDACHRPLWCRLGTCLQLHRTYARLRRSPARQLCHSPRWCPRHCSRHFSSPQKRNWGVRLL